MPDIYWQSHHRDVQNLITSMEHIKSFKKVADLNSPIIDLHFSFDGQWLSVIAMEEVSIWSTLGDKVGCIVT